MVVFGGGADYTGAAQLCQLHGQVPHPARCAVDDHALT